MNSLGIQQAKVREELLRSTKYNMHNPTNLEADFLPKALKQTSSVQAIFKFQFYRRNKLVELNIHEPVHEKNNNLHRRKQSRRSASR